MPHGRPLLDPPAMPAMAGMTHWKNSRRSPTRSAAEFRLRDEETARPYASRARDRGGKNVARRDALGSQICLLNLLGELAFIARIRYQSAWHPEAMMMTLNFAKLGRRVRNLWLALTTPVEPQKYASDEQGEEARWWQANK